MYLLQSGVPMNDLLHKAVIQIRDQEYCEGVYDALGFTLYSAGQLCADRPGGYIGSCNVILHRTKFSLIFYF